MTPLHVRPPTVGPQLTFSPSPFLTPRHSCHAAARLLPGGTEVPRGQGLFISASPLEPGPEQGPTGFWAPSPLAHMTLTPASAPPCPWYLLRPLAAQGASELLGHHFLPDSQDAADSSPCHKRGSLLVLLALFRTLTASTTHTC